MKTKTIVSVLFALVASFTNAQPVIQSYASTVPALEASLPSLDSQFVVPDTDVASVNLVSFATRIDFPPETTSATVNSISFSLVKKIGGVQTTQISNASMNNSSWNVEGGTGSPHIFARDHSSALIAKTGVLAGNPIPNVKTLYFTKHNFVLVSEGPSPFKKFVQVDDSYRLIRSMNISWTVGGVTQSTVLNTQADVVVIKPPKVVSVNVDDGSFHVHISGVNPADYGETWYLQTSTTVGSQPSPWVPATNGTVSGNTVVSFPVIEGEPARFWRVGYILNPSPPET